MFERRQDVLETLAAIWGSNALLTVDYTEKPFEELKSRFTATWAPGKQANLLERTLRS